MLMIVYGALGLGLLAVTAAAVTGPLGDVRRLSTSMEGQRQGIIRALETTARTLEDAGTGLGRLDTSLARAHDSTGQAGTLSRGVAETMRQLSAAMAIQILGAQPLIGLSASFDQSAAQLEALGGSIDGIASSLDANSADLRLTRNDISDLRTQVQSMTLTLRGGPSLEVPAATIDGVRLVLFALMAWLAVLALGITLAGLALVVRSRAPRR
jgi:hypothetical protein